MVKNQKNDSFIQKGSEGSYENQVKKMKRKYIHRIKECNRYVKICNLRTYCMTNESCPFLYGMIAV